MVKKFDEFINEGLFGRRYSENDAKISELTQRILNIFESLSEYDDHENFLLTRDVPRLPEYRKYNYGRYLSFDALIETESNIVDSSWRYDADLISNKGEQMSEVLGIAVFYGDNDNVRVEFEGKDENDNDLYLNIKDTDPHSVERLVSKIEKNYLR